jgi:pyruvate formate lyase activating enzyme
MRIAGLQKLTLLDYPGKIACTLFTPGCNYRCPFCHNASLVLTPTDETTEEEFLLFLSSRRQILEGVCITGGEPTLQPDLASFCKKIKEMGFLVKLDTNGSHPKKLKELVEHHLVDYVAMDVKNSLLRYEETVGTKVNLEDILESIEFLEKDTVPYEFRTTVVKNLHDEESLINLAEMIQGCQHYYLQNFVDSKNLINNSMSGYSEQEMSALYQAVKKILPQTSVRGIDLNQD